MSALPATPYDILSIDDLVPSPTNPRTIFDPAKLEELAETIRKHGVVQPILVRPLKEPAGAYEIVCGERRYRASLLADAKGIPATIKDLSDADVLELQIIENAQRSDVHPMEECAGFRRILDSGTYGTGTAAVETLAGKIGKSVKYIYDRLKLDSLTDEAKQEFIEGNITAGHAILLARVSPQVQADALSDMLWLEVRPDTNDGSWVRTAERLPNGCARSVRELQAWLQVRGIKLENPPFDMSDAQLLPMAGSCTDCPKRSGNEALFEEGQNAFLCRDRKCFDAKVRQANDNRIRDLKNAGHMIGKVSPYYNPTKGMGIGRDEYTTSVEGAEGAVPAIICNPGKDTDGTLTWVKLAPPKPKAKPGEALARSRAQLEAERNEKLDRFRRKLLLSSVAAAIPQEVTESFFTDFLIQLYTGGRMNVNRGRVRKFMGWKGSNEKDDLRDISQLTPAGMVQFGFIMLFEAVPDNSWVSIKPLTQWATANGVDLSKVEDAVQAAVPPIPDAKPEKKAQTSAKSKKEKVTA